MKEAKVKYNRKEKNTKGITLIALVVTIVVLLILAGISLSLVLGENGLIAKAKESRDKTKSSSDMEKISLAVADAMMSDAGNGMSELNESGLRTALEKEFKGTKVELTESGGDYLVEIGDEGQYIVEDDGQVSEYKEDENPGVLEKLAEDVYEINSIEDLVALSCSVNKKEDIYIGKTIELGRSLNFQSDFSYKDLSVKYGLVSGVGYVKNDTANANLKYHLTEGNGFVPIGVNPAVGFYGTINGNDKAIKNMKITKNSGWDGFGGLIGARRYENQEELNVNKLGIKNANIETSQSAGGILGSAYSNSGKVNINDCFATGNINASSYAGGIFGQAYGNIGEVNINNCYIIGNISAGDIAGGIVGGSSNGSNILTIINCHSEGKIESKNSFAGGIIGRLYSDESNKTLKIENCYNKSEISSNGFAGGVVGRIEKANNIEIKNSYNTNKVTGNAQTGGIIGYCETKTIAINDTYNKGEITSTATKEGCYAGGIIGEIKNAEEVSINNSYNEVKGENGIKADWHVGGIVGYNNNSKLTINDCYNKSKISGNAHDGGIVGSVYGTTEINNSYNEGIVTSGHTAGGIVGTNNSGLTINNCYNKAEIIETWEYSLRWSSNLCRRNNRKCWWHSKNRKFLQ